jgi:hypothetical protein
MTLRNLFWQPLFDAANSREPISPETLSEIKNLIATIQAKTAQGENISVDEYDYSTEDTPLIAAARSGQENIVRLLLNAKATLDIENRFGATALMEAIEKSNLQITQLLLDAGAKIENGTKYTVLDRAIDLHLSALQDRFDNAIDLTDNLSVIRTLLQHGAFIHHPEKLYKFLTYCDISDPNVLGSLHFLDEHLKRGYEPQTLLSEVKKVTNEVDIIAEAYKADFETWTEEAMQTLLPSDLRKIVYSYDASIERLGFFKLQKLLPETTTQPNIAEEKTEPAEHKKCSVM